MRPVRRGLSPQVGPFDSYQNAKVPLLGRLGLYCSYCERRIQTNLAVEHIQPKGLPVTAYLETEWTNFLLACVNCNSTKGHKPVVLSDVLLPDRDNTYLAYEYSIDGKIRVREHLEGEVRDQAQSLLTLTGLDRDLYNVFDDNGKQIVVDRASKRIESMAMALDQVEEIRADPENESLRRSTAKMAFIDGLFSVWMTAFEGDADMQNRFIEIFPGTRDSGCFGAVGNDAVSPHPNADTLPFGGRI